MIAEANRIFGHANWDRQTIVRECVASRTTEGAHAVSYLLRVRITVRAGETLIVREGCGSAEAFADTLGLAHERAAKALEIDATKRVLSTFGPSFGLSLYAGLTRKSAHAARTDGETTTKHTRALAADPPLDPDTGLPHNTNGHNA